MTFDEKYEERAQAFRDDLFKLSLSYLMCVNPSQATSCGNYYACTLVALQDTTRAR